MALLVAMMVLAASVSQAGRDGDRGAWHGGGRSRSVGGLRVHDGGGRTNGGGNAWVRGGGSRTNGGGRGYARGGRSYGGSRWSYGGGSHRYGGGGSGYGAGSRGYSGGYSRTYARCAPIVRGGGVSYYRGAPDCGPRYSVPYVYRYSRPRSVVSFGINLGVPYYCPPACRYHVRPAPVIVEAESEIDVQNEPPAGCYYYDPFCEREFHDLDGYTDHIDNEDHAKTIQIIDRDSGEQVRTLEFVDGYWSVRR